MISVTIDGKAILKPHKNRGHVNVVNKLRWLFSQSEQIAAMQSALRLLASRLQYSVPSLEHEPGALYSSPATDAFDIFLDRILFHANSLPINYNETVGRLGVVTNDEGKLRYACSRGCL